jgi:streptomycin 6-kinase
MSMDEVDHVPAVVRRTALRAGAGDWLAALPDLVASLAAEWSISVGRAYPDPTEAFVLAAERADGTPCVLKLVVPRDGDPAALEIAVLRLAGGDGCVRLLRHDTARGALLLERLGRPLVELGLPIRRRHEILLAAARQVWRPAPGSGLPTGAAKAARLAARIVRDWEALGRPCSERAVAHAVACAERRGAAHDDERAVLLHGDVHQWNALQAARAAEGFVLVDPDGLLAEPEFDLGVLMREDQAELLTGDPWERARWLAARTGLDATAIGEWGAAERVSNGLLLHAIALEPHARDSLAAAERIAAEYPAP